MADYRTIADAEVDPDAPLTSSLGYAWRDNPIAIAEGATGAPRIVDAALSTTVTNAGQSWVFNRIIARAPGGIGQSVFCHYIPSSPQSISFGTTVSGSDIVPSSASSTLGGSGSPLSGTWRCMGSLSADPGGSKSLFQRIS